MTDKTTIEILERSAERARHAAQFGCGTTERADRLSALPFIMSGDGVLATLPTWLGHEIRLAVSAAVRDDARMTVRLENVLKALGLLAEPSDYP